MKLWEYKWFISLIAWCRKWSWFDTYIYGKSSSLEDFVRNPAEVLRDTFFPFIVKGVKAYSVINLRIGYIPYNPANPIPNCWSVPMGSRGFGWINKNLCIFDIRFFNPWYTKFCNASFFCQVAVSLWHYIPIPYVSLNFRIGEDRYFQFGLGWGAETSGNAVLCGKLRYVNQKKSDENILNPTDVVGYYEGTI